MTKLCTKIKNAENVKLQHRYNPLTPETPSENVKHLLRENVPILTRYLFEDRVYVFVIETEHITMNLQKKRRERERIDLTPSDQSRLRFRQRYGLRVFFKTYTNFEYPFALSVRSPVTRNAQLVHFAIHKFHCLKIILRWGVSVPKETCAYCAINCEKLGDFYLPK